MLRFTHVTHTPGEIVGSKNDAVEAGHRKDLIDVSHGVDVPKIVSWETLGNALANPELWLGAILGVAMIAAAVHFRRNRELAD